MDVTQLSYMRYKRNGHTVLALETSCDETAVAIVRAEQGKPVLMANKIASQIEEHSQWGGVVPEIASRMHLEIMPFLIGDVLQEAGIEDMHSLDAIAATVTPGLAGSLLIGSVTGRTLAALHSLPFLGIHHLEGHLSSVLLSEKPPQPPYLVLLVSGGHTELIHHASSGKFNRVGYSHDDAAGEAFDKVARLLGLPYPGGPAIQQASLSGNPKKYVLPKGRVSKPGGGFYPFDFSFSGLKTAMLRQVESLKKIEEELPIEDLAASFQNVVAEVLVDRSLKCAQELGVKSLVMVGGVAANNHLRQMMASRAVEYDVSIHLAPREFCTDNAAMVGAAALIRLKSGDIESSLDLGVSPRWPLDKANLFYELSPPF